MSEWHDSFNSWLTKTFQEFKSTHDSIWLYEFNSSQRLKACQKAFQNFESNWFMTRKIWIRINPWPIYALGSMYPYQWHYDWAYIPFDLTWLCLLVWRFWAFDSTVSSGKNWFESIHDSRSISDSWIDSTHDSIAFSENWLRINSRLKQIPRYWFRRNHDSSSFSRNRIKLTRDSKRFPTFRFKSAHNSDEKNNSKFTHDSTLRVIFVSAWAIRQVRLFELNSGKISILIVYGQKAYVSTLPTRGIRWY